MESKEPTRLASAEPPARMISPDTYTSGSQNNSIVTPPQDEVVQHARIPFSSVVTSVSKPSEFSAPPYHGGSAPNLMPHGMSLSEPLKKKRGRPRKYGPDGTMALALCPFSSVPSYSTPLFKRNRGRPRGSGKRQQLNALGSSGIGFTPHVITVKAGEDVASKIMSFSQQGPRAICIISANGAISNVTLRQPAISGGTVTYEGRFEIISLSGSFLLTETGGTRSRTGGLSVSLAGPDGRVLGGGVAGLLIAATPVQLVVGSFISEGKKPRPRPPPPDLREPSSAVPHMSNLAADAAASPQSRGTMSESSGGPNSPPNQSINTGQSHGGMPSYPHTSWPSSQAMAGDIQH